MSHSNGIALHCVNIEHRLSISWLCPTVTRDATPVLPYKHPHVKLQRLLHCWWSVWVKDLSHTLRLRSCTAEPAAGMHSLVSSSRTCGLTLVLVLVHHSAVGSAPSGHGVVVPANACKLCLAFGMTCICKFCIDRPVQIRFENCVTWLYCTKAHAQGGCYF